MKAYGPFLVPVAGASAAPEQATAAMSDVLAAAWAARKQDTEGLAAVFANMADPRGSFGMAVAVIAGIFEFGRVDDETVRATLATVADGCVAGIAAEAPAAAGGQEQPAVAWIPPGRMIDATRDAVALVRAFMAGDAEGVYVLLSGTRDPAGCMAALAAVCINVLTRFGADQAAAGPLLDDIARSMQDSALDTFPVPSQKAPLTREERAMGGEVSLSDE